MSTGDKFSPKKKPNGYSTDIPIAGDHLLNATLKSELNSQSQY